MIGYEPTQLQGKSLYKFIHPYDCQQLKQLHETGKQCFGLITIFELDTSIIERNKICTYKRFWNEVQIITITFLKNINEKRKTKIIHINVYISLAM